ncbi:MAG: contact-dependent growth inhibition system immunity protein [Sphaerospermopsis kisseleviana]
MNQQKSLEQLEANYWGESPEDAPRLVKECYKLRKKPIHALDTEEIRILISQEIGLNYVMPLAIKSLEKDILVAGDFYPGDLLLALLRIDSKTWGNHELLRQELKKIINNQINKLESTLLNQEIKEDIKKNIDDFLKS